MSVHFVFSSSQCKVTIMAAVNDQIWEVLFIPDEGSTEKRIFVRMSSLKINRVVLKDAASTAICGWYCQYTEHPAEEQRKSTACAILEPVKTFSERIFISYGFPLYLMTRPSSVVFKINDNPTISRTASHMVHSHTSGLSFFLCDPDNWRLPMIKNVGISVQNKYVCPIQTELLLSSV